ncbi:hypothetical protein [Nocardia tengchongensis]|uniref:hypothetical protein n=1 Tax=Nocardia tengchongensis TaxID=2055889 RepID=UPI0036518DCE
MPDALYPWMFHYDEDDFIIAENQSYSDQVCHAISDFVDDIRNLHKLQRLLATWPNITANYPNYPIGYGFNATCAEYIGGGHVTIKSLYSMFSTVTVSEPEFLRAVTEFRDFLSAVRRAD